MTHFFYDHARSTLAIVLLASGLLGLSTLRLSIDNSPEQLLRDGDPELLLYTSARRDFGTGDWIVISLTPPELYDPAFLTTLHEIHDALESGVPHLNEITSLVNVRRTYGVGDTLFVDPLMPEPPQTPAGLEELRAQVEENPLYLNLLVSGDHRVTTILLELDTYSTSDSSSESAAGSSEARSAAGGLGNADFDDDDAQRAPDLTLEEKRVAARKVHEILKPYRSSEVEIHVAGGPILETHLLELVSRDMGLFMGISAAITIALLWLLFRRVSGAVLPITVVALSLVSTMGLMGLFQMPLTLITQILPSFLLVTGVTDTVHILVLFYRNYERTGDKRESLAQAVEHSGIPVIWTSVTTAGGLASFAAAELGPIADLGLLGPIGVGFALLYTLVLLPALISVFPLAPPRPARSDAAVVSSFDRALGAAGAMAIRRPWRVLGTVFILLLVSAIGITKLRFAHDIMAWLPEEDSFRIANEAIERDLAGVMLADVIIDTGRSGGLNDPAFLRRMEAFEAASGEIREAHIEVEKVISIANIVKEVHKALNENSTEYYRVPADERAVAQELLLFESHDADAIFELADSNYQIARMRLQMPWADSMLYVPFLEKLRAQLQQTLGPDVEIGITGLTGLMARVMSALVTSMARSYVIALLVIAPLMIVILRSVPLGLASMLPNALPIILVIGGMGWLGIPLDASNIMIGSIVLGIAVDDTIHLFHKLREYLETSQNLEEAVRQTLTTTGRALAFTSLVLSGGLLSFAFAYTSNIFYFGVLAAAAIGIAFIADILVTPALVAIGWSKR